MLKFQQNINQSILLIASLIVISCIIFFFLFKNESQIVYVDNIKVFSSFLMTKEMKSTGEKELNMRTRGVDSLYQLLDSTTDSNKKQLLVKQIIAEKDFIENFQQNFPQEESDKIWKRIATYSENFAKENDYKLVLGLHPDMNIIYGDASINVSDEFIKYINTKYEGK